MTLLKCNSKCPSISTCLSLTVCYPISQMLDDHLLNKPSVGRNEKSIFLSCCASFRLLRCWMFKVLHHLPWILCHTACLAVMGFRPAESWDSGADSCPVYPQWRHNLRPVRSHCPNYQGLAINPERKRDRETERRKVLFIEDVSSVLIANSLTQTVQ